MPAGLQLVRSLTVLVQAQPTFPWIRGKVSQTLVLCRNQDGECRLDYIAPPVTCPPEDWPGCRFEACRKCLNTTLSPSKL